MRTEQAEKVLLMYHPEARVYRMQGFKGNWWCVRNQPMGKILGRSRISRGDAIRTVAKKLLPESRWSLTKEEATIARMFEGMTLPEIKVRVVELALLAALKEAKGNQGIAAHRLGVHRNTVSRVQSIREAVYK